LLLRIRALLSKTPVQSSILNVAEPAFKKARLLTIDDSRTYLEFLSSNLEAEGYDVQQATNGEKGLERIRTESFDCVLVDLMMPRLDGIEVCRSINAMRSTLQRPVGVLM